MPRLAPLAIAHPARPVTTSEANAAGGDSEPAKSGRRGGPAHRMRQSRHGRPPRRWARRLLVATNVVVALALVTSASAVGYVRYRFHQVRTVKAPGLRRDPAGQVSQAPMNILLVGSNTRTGLSPSEAKQFGSATDVPGARSDVTMVLHLDPSTRSATLLSIPRDLFMPLPPHSIAGAVGKIDATLNDGPEHLIEAVSGNLGIPIDHYVEVNFDGFQHVIDALGGINLDFPTQLRDSFSGLNITRTGCQHLNGAAALAVVRARHLLYYAHGSFQPDPQSDLSRIRRDHEFLKVFVDTVEAKGLSNPLEVNAVLGSLVHQVTLDSNFSLNTMISLVREYRNLNADAVPTTTLPITQVPNYHWRGGTYGDVDMPAQPQDQQTIDDFLGVKPPASPPAVFVQLVNTSGSAAKAAAVSSQLAAVGFTVTGVSPGTSPATIAETVIHYHPGSVAQAQQVMASLFGAVMMTPDPTVPDGHAVIDVGNVLTVKAPAAATSSPSTSPTATTAPTSTTVAVPTPNGQPVSSASDQPQSFDPTACPASH